MVTIGRHGSPWTPDEAREEAKRLIGDVAKKIDPAAQRRADREAMTFGALCDLYLAEGVAHKKPLTITADIGRIEHHLKPLLGKKRVVAIGRDDIERLLVDVKSGKTKAAAPEKRRPGTLPQGGAGVAAQCVTLAATILKFAIDRKIRADNPAAGIKKPPVRKMQCFLSDAELGKLADALNGLCRQRRQHLSSGCDPSSSAHRSAKIGDPQFAQAGGRPRARPPRSTGLKDRREADPSWPARCRSLG
jgi:hypothetical protein